MSIINSFNKIKQEIKDNDSTLQTEIIAVSKTFSLEHIKPLIEYGHLHNGENKVQQAEKKWIELNKQHHPDNLISKGLPQEFKDHANQELSAINLAYDKIKKQREIN